MKLIYNAVVAVECTAIARAAGAVLPDEVVDPMSALPPENGTSILYDGSRAGCWRGMRARA